MRRMIDLTGRRFGKLSVISFAEIRKSHPYFNCLCDCGNTCTIRGGSLTSGDTFSCGCIRQEYLANMGNRSKKNLMVNGIEYSRSEFCQKYSLSLSTLSRKIKKGMTPEEIIKEMEEKNER